MVRVSKKCSMKVCNSKYSLVSKSCSVRVSVTITQTLRSVSVIVIVESVVSVDVALALSPVDPTVEPISSDDELVLVCEDVEMSLLVPSVVVSMHVVVPGTGPVTVVAVEDVPVTKMGLVVVVVVSV